MQITFQIEAEGKMATGRLWDISQDELLRAAENGLTYVSTCTEPDRSPDHQGFASMGEAAAHAARAERRTGNEYAVYRLVNFEGTWMCSYEDTRPSECEYQLSGQVETEWLDSVEEALEKYNEAVRQHNLTASDEDDEYAYLEHAFGDGACSETLSDGTVRYQWVNPHRDAGTVYLEIRDRAKNVEVQ